MPRVGGDPRSGQDPHAVAEAAGRSASRQEGLRLRWFRLVTIGASVSGLPPLLAGVLTAHSSVPIVGAALLVAGVLQGGVLGWFQAHALRKVLSRLPIRDWVAATAAGVGLAWAALLAPLVWSARIGAWSPHAQTPLVVVVAVAMLLVPGAVQRSVLRRWTDLADVWVWASAVGWVAASTALAVVVGPLLATGATVPVVVAAGLLGGLAAAVAMAAVTGAFMVRILAEWQLTLPADQ